MRRAEDETGLHVPFRSVMMSPSALKEKKGGNAIWEPNVVSLVEAMKAGWALEHEDIPPVIAIGTEQDAEIIDGHHRVEAARRLGIQVPVILLSPEQVKGIDQSDAAFSAFDQFEDEHRKNKGASMRSAWRARIAGQDIIPAGQIVRAVVNIVRVDGSVAVQSGTLGHVQRFDRDDPKIPIYWVIFGRSVSETPAKPEEIEVYTPPQNISPKGATASSNPYNSLCPHCGSPATQAQRCGGPNQVLGHHACGQDLMTAEAHPAEHEWKRSEQRGGRDPRMDDRGHIRCAAARKPVDWAQIKSAAEAIRAQVKADPLYGGRDAEKLGETVGDIPYECCGRLNESMFRFLIQEGYGAVAQLVSGQFVPEGSPDGREHVWVELSGQIVDLASDQFDAKRPAVFIGSIMDKHYVGGDVIQHGLDDGTIAGSDEDLGEPFDWTEKASLRGRFAARRKKKRVNVRSAPPDPADCAEVAAISAVAGKKIDWDHVRAVAQQVRGQFVVEPGKSSKDRCVEINKALAQALRAEYGDAVALRYGPFNDDRGGEFHHWWVEIGGRVIDAAADQFNSGIIDKPMPEIYIGERSPRYRAESFYSGDEIDKKGSLSAKWMERRADAYNPKKKEKVIQKRTPVDVLAEAGFSDPQMLIRDLWSAFTKTGAREHRDHSITSVHLTGSRWKGDARPDSDLDVVVFHNGNAMISEANQAFRAKVAEITGGTVDAFLLPETEPWGHPMSGNIMTLTASKSTSNFFRAGGRQSPLGSNPDGLRAPARTTAPSECGPRAAIAPSGNLYDCYMDHANWFRKHFGSEEYPAGWVRFNAVADLCLSFSQAPTDQQWAMMSKLLLVAEGSREFFVEDMSGSTKMDRTATVDEFRRSGKRLPEFVKAVKYSDLGSQKRREAARNTPGGQRVILNDDVRVWARAAENQNDRVPSIVLPKGTSIWIIRRFKLNHGGSPALLEIKWIDESGGGASGEYGHGVARAVDVEFAGTVGQIEISDAKSWDPLDENVACKGCGRRDLPLHTDGRCPGCSKNAPIDDAPETPADVPGMKPAERQKKIDALLERWSKEPEKRPQIEEQLKSLRAFQALFMLRRAADTMAVEDQTRMKVLQRAMNAPGQNKNDPAYLDWKREYDELAAKVKTPSLAPEKWITGSLKNLWRARRAGDAAGRLEGSTRGEEENIAQALAAEVIIPSLRDIAALWAKGEAGDGGAGGLNQPAKLNVNGVWFVGSRAGGTAGRKSDWDFAVTFTTEPPVPEGDEVSKHEMEDSLARALRLKAITHGGAGMSELFLDFFGVYGTEPDPAGNPMDLGDMDAGERPAIRVAARAPDFSRFRPDIAAGWANLLQEQGVAEAVPQAVMNAAVETSIENLMHSYAANGDGEDAQSFIAQWFDEDELCTFVALWMEHGQAPIPGSLIAAAKTSANWGSQITEEEVAAFQNTGGERQSLLGAWRRRAKDELWAPDPEIVKNTWRRYACTVCGNVQAETTNHLGAIMSYCKKCSWAPSKGECYNPMGDGRCYRKFTYFGEIDERHQDSSGFWDSNGAAWNKRGGLIDRWLMRVANDPLKKTIEIGGVKIGIEWPKGTIRTWDHLPNNDYRVKMKADYGYIKGTEGDDGEEVDVYAGPNRESTKVFLVEQLKDDGSYDEEKYMLGYDNITEAKNSYLDHMEKEKMGAVKALSWEKFLKLVPKSQKKKALENAKEERQSLLRTWKRRANANPDKDDALFAFQDSTIEHLPKDLQNIPEANILGIRLENAGDIFRELVWRDYPDPGYIGEKTAKIARHLTNPEMSRSMPHEALLIMNEIAELFTSIDLAGKSPILIAARDLSVALARQDFGRAATLLPIFDQVGQMRMAGKMLKSIKPTVQAVAEQLRGQGFCEPGTDPAGQCEIASADLAQTLANMGIETWIVEGTVGNEGHVWVEVFDMDGTILGVDITADQFGRKYSGVMVVDVNDPAWANHREESRRQVDSKGEIGQSQFRDDTERKAQSLFAQWVDRQAAGAETIIGSVDHKNKERPVYVPTAQLQEWLKLRASVNSRSYKDVPEAEFKALQAMERKIADDAAARIDPAWPAWSAEQQKSGQPYDDILWTDIQRILEYYGMNEDDPSQFTAPKPKTMPAPPEADNDARIREAVYTFFDQYHIAEMDERAAADLMMNMAVVLQKDMGMTMDQAKAKLSTLLIEYGGGGPENLHLNSLRSRWQRRAKNDEQKLLRELVCTVIGSDSGTTNEAVLPKGTVVGVQPWSNDHTIFFYSTFYSKIIVRGRVMKSNQYSAIVQDFRAATDIGYGEGTGYKHGPECFCDECMANDDMSTHRCPTCGSRECPGDGHSIDCRKPGTMTLKDVPTETRDSLLDKFNKGEIDAETLRRRMKQITSSLLGRWRRRASGLEPDNRSDLQRMADDIFDYIGDNPKADHNQIIKHIAAKWGGHPADFEGAVWNAVTYLIEDERRLKWDRQRDQWVQKAEPLIQMPPAPGSKPVSQVMGDLPVVDPTAEKDRLLDEFSKGTITQTDLDQKLKRLQASAEQPAEEPEDDPDLTMEQKVQALLYEIARDNESSGYVPDNEDLTREVTNFIADESGVDAEQIDAKWVQELLGKLEYPGWRNIATPENTKPDLPPNVNLNSMRQRWQRRASGEMTIETEHGKYYRINSKGEIIRLDMKGFQPSGQWRLVGIRNPGSGVMIPFEQFKNGIPDDVFDWEVIDYDHGTKRVWGEKLRSISISGNPPWAKKKAPEPKKVRPSTGDSARMIENAIIDLLRKGPSPISRDLHEILEGGTVSVNEHGEVDSWDAPFADMVSDVIGKMLDRGMIMFDGSTAEFSLLKEPEPTTPEHLPGMTETDRQQKVDALLDQLSTEKDPKKKKQIEQRLRSLQASVHGRWQLRRSGEEAEAIESRSPGAISSCEHGWPGKKEGERGWCGRCGLGAQ